MPQDYYKDYRKLNLDTQLKDERSTVNTMLRKFKLQL